MTQPSAGGSPAAGRKTWPTNSRHRAGLSPLGVSGIRALFTSGRKRVDVVGGERLAGYAPVAAANLFDGHPSDRP